MKSVTSRTKLVAGFVTLILTSGLMVGCANPLDQLVEGGIENAIRDQIRDQTGVDIDVGSGSGASVPDSWPAEVPVPDFRITTSATVPDGWVLNFEVSGKADWETHLQKLESSGFENSGINEIGEIHSAILNSANYQIVSGYIGDGGPGVMSFVVTKRDN